MNLPRKRRTRQHVIADLGVHHVEGFIYREGHTAERVLHDYGYDLLMFTYDTEGNCEAGLLFIQAKSTEQLHQTSTEVTFDVDVRDYSRWRSERNPVILILYEASRDRAYWLHVQDYDRENTGRRLGTKSTRVRVPMNQRLTRYAIRRWQSLNRDSQLRMMRDEP